MYRDQNPRFTRRIDNQHRWTVNVWGGVIGNYVIGPYFIDGHLNGNVYLNFLEHELPELLEEVPLNIIRSMWYQHDGAPAHSTRLVRYFLNRQFGQRWVGRGGPISYPPRSPDLTPCDFFVGVC